MSSPTEPSGAVASRRARLPAVAKTPCVVFAVRFVGSPPVQEKADGLFVNWLVASPETCVKFAVALALRSQAVPARPQWIQAAAPSKSTKAAGGWSRRQSAPAPGTQSAAALRSSAGAARAQRKPTVEARS